MAPLMRRVLMLGKFLISGVHEDLGIEDARLQDSQLLDAKLPDMNRHDAVVLDQFFHRQ